MSTTQGIWQQGFFRHSFLLLAATQVGNACNLLFQILMIRTLTVVEYGILASMFSLILIMSAPLEALRTAVAHQAALLIRLGQGGAIKAFLMQWARILGGVGACLALVGILFGRPIAHFFQIPSAAPVVMVFFIMTATLYMPLFSGALQGTQSFRWLALQGQVMAVIRLGLGGLLLYAVHATAAMGLLAQAGGVLISLVLGLIALRHILRAHTEPLRIPFTGVRYFLLSLFALVGFGILMNADIALVKRFFTPEEAGVFAQATTIGRAIIFLPIPIAGVMFPKVVSSGLSSAMDRRLLWMAIGTTVALIVIPASIVTMATSFIWWIFTGIHPDADMVLLMRWIIWAMAPLGLTFLLMNFEIAQRRFRGPLLLIPVALAYIGGVSLWHETYAQVLTVMTTVSVGSLVVMLVDMARAMRHPSSAEIDSISSSEAPHTRTPGRTTAA